MPASDELQAPPRQATGLGLGERLRSARKARALSVAQVADALRLGEASVLALEEERFDVLGAPVFIRGHLKRYAEIVGLSTAAVLDAYRVAAPDSDAPPSLARPREQPDALRLRPWVYWVIAAVILVGIVVSIISSDDDAPAPALSPAALESTQVAPETADAPGVAMGVPAAPLAAEGAAAGAGVSEPMTVTLEFMEDAWVNVEDGERRLLYGLQLQGSRQELAGRSPFRIMLGNARGTRVVVNGQPFSIPSDSVDDNIARFVIPASSSAAPRQASDD